MSHAHEFIRGPYAMEQHAWRAFLCRTAMLEKADPKAFFFLLEDEHDEPELEVRGGVAVIHVNGPLVRRDSSYLCCYPRLRQQVTVALERADVRAIVFDIDSPGGDAVSIAELSDVIFAGRDEKPIDAVIRGLGCSAAYFIASSASSVFAARDSIIGSIGTVMTLFDWSKFDEEMGIQEINIVSSQSPKKLPDPTTVEGRSQLQEEVDAIADVFVRSVARNRGVTPDTVLSSYGQGGVFIGERAVTAGLADGIATVDEVVAARSAGRPIQFERPLPAVGGTA